MRFSKIQVWTGWHDAIGVNGRVADVIMVFDMKHIDRLSNPFVLEELAGVSPKTRVVNQATYIAFEMTHIDGIETNKRGK